MKAPVPLWRLSKASVSNRFTRKPLYRCLHASNRLDQGPSKDAGKSGLKTAATRSKSSRPTGQYTNHLIPEEELTVRRGKRLRTDKPGPTKNLQPYTKEQLEDLKSKYSPQQIAAIKAGEASISSQDIMDQGALYQGPMALSYLDDFSQLRSAIDKRPEVPGIRDPKTGKVPEFRWKDDQDMLDDLEDWLDKQPDDGGDEMNWQKFLNETKSYHSKEKDIDVRARNYTAPTLPVIDDPIIRYQVRAAQDSVEKDGKDTAQMDRLSKQIGLSLQQMEDYQPKTLMTRRVANQTRLGKTISWHVMAVAGNKSGLLGLGEGKSTEMSDAAAEAHREAIRNLTPVSRYEQRTIFGNVKGKCGATELELFTRRPGFGNRCSALIYEICKMAGIRDISARVTRSRTPMNVIKATVEALANQRDPEEIALARGRRMVDLRKVYYHGRNG